jgi:hypothetical protein
MMELALVPHTNISLPAAREIYRDDEPAICKYNEAVFGCNIESNTMVLTPLCHWLDQDSDSNNMKCSRLSDRKKEVAEEGKFRLKNGIDNNSGMTFQW